MASQEDAPKRVALAEKPAPIETPFPLATLRHSVSHLMASAVEALYPGAKFGNGPAIEHGFYYDIELPKPLEERDLERIENEMRRIAKKAGAMVRSEYTRAEARARLVQRNQTFKLDTLERIPEGEAITFYAHAGWEDLCEGPHIDRFDQPFAFKLQRVAGAYWMGDEANPMLQRIYGTAFWTKEDLERHLQWLVEVERCDHRHLGTELDLFSHHQEAGGGFIFWHPKLGAVRREMETFWWDLHQARGYMPVYTPHVARETLFAVSGHLENYADLMYAPMAIDELPYRVKPMNCPGHILIYQNRGRSYRELPLRWAELGTVYRYERSGVLHGMLRVRGFTQDDSHIFCTPEQLPAEIAGVLELVRSLLSTYGFEFTAYLATRPAKAIGSEEVWARAIAALKEGAVKAGIALELDEGGGAFYGPKIDFKMKDALGREWQTSTVQCDFNLPERFDLHFTDKDGAKKRPIMVHRAIYGSLERFAGVLIEHYGGKFPFWLAPTQVALIPIREAHADYARELARALEAEGLRVACMDDAVHMNKKIKEATHDKVPFLLIAGDREVAERKVTVRQRDREEQASVPFEEFLARVTGLRRTRSLGLD